MISDSFGRNLAFGLLIVMILYYRFIRFTINMRGEYNNRKCSPINMFMSGMIGTTGEEIFEQCASNVTEESISKEFKTFSDSRERAMEDNYNNLNNKTADISNKVANDASTYLENAEVTAATAAEMQRDQERMKQTINESSGILSNSLSTIRRIASNFSDAAKAFVNSDPVQKL